VSFPLDFSCHVDHQAFVAPFILIKRNNYRLSCQFGLLHKLLVLLVKKKRLYKVYPEADERSCVRLEFFCLAADQSFV